MGHSAIALIEWFRADPLATLLLIAVLLAATLAPLPAMPLDTDPALLKSASAGDRLSLKIADNLLVIVIVVLGILLFNRLLEIVSLGRPAFIAAIGSFGATIVVQRYLSAFIRRAVAHRNRLS